MAVDGDTILELPLADINDMTDEGVSEQILGGVSMQVPNSVLREYLSADFTAAANRSANQGAVLGDSIGKGSNTDLVNNTYADDSWAWNAAILSNQRFRLMHNAGIGGNTTAQMAARVQTDVIPYAPQFCFVAVGSPNDYGSGPGTFAYSQANVLSIITQLLRVGITPVLVSVLPYDTTPAYAAVIDKLNAWGAEYAARNGLIYINTHRAVVDPATGLYLAACTTDGTHLTRVGARLVGQAVATAMSAILPPAPIFLSDYSVGARFNLIPGGNFQIDTNADGVADGWTAGGTTTTGSITPSLVAMTAPDVGKWQQWVMASLVSAFRSYTTANVNVGSGFAVGDRLAFSARLQTSGCEAGTNTSFVRVNFNGAGTYWSPFYQTQIDIADGTLYYEGVVPVGTTSINIATIFNGNNGAGAGSGTVRLGNVSLINLTELGF